MSTKPPNVTPVSVEPLTRRNTSGKVYKRSSAVEVQISAALSLSDEELVSRASIREETANGYLQEESLVYLIRTSYQRKNNFLCNKLSEILLTRCQEQVAFRVRAIEQKDDAFNDVVRVLFEKILAPDNSGDFLQVRFRFALKRISISIFHQYYRDQIEERENLRPSSFQSLDGQENEKDDWDQVHVAIDSDLPVEDSFSSVELESLKREALQILKEPIRTAFILHHIKGWQIESNNPKEITVSGYLETTPRTIRNWLQQAEKELRKWRGDHHE
ncbi:MAG: hypothetical protein JMDDDDMK_00167 [Acidobacteria bacterium]|nr:hypothetical protein [Acidobacteriota bacterium]